jgi:hypothetical protein
LQEVLPKTVTENFTKFFFKQMLYISAFYLEKQKSFIPKKKYGQSCSL